MQQTGEYTIGASRDVVWADLNDPQVLAACIDGCESMEQRGDDLFVGVVKAKVGPVSARFTAELLVTDAQPPESYSIVASVKGGAAGFGKGTALVNLVEQGPEVTVLRYDVSANVGGKLAQVGGRLIDSAARKMADDFFAAFRARFDGADEPGPSSEPTAPAAREAAPAGSGRWPVWLIVLGVVVLTIVLVLAG